ncbi:MAG: HEPN domain-containing protein [Betaproteobacteria bacterium]|nr:MAG: HEPN domain-containing protein [Betaproteobacteria bacterium]
MATPADLLAHAKELLKSAGKDLEYRLVIERAYYAAFHAAQEFEEALPRRSQVSTDKTGSHDGLFQRLECPDAKLDYGLRIISQDIGAQMRLLKPLRELASYELHETIRVDQAEAAIAGAEEVMAECGKARKKITGG